MPVNNFITRWLARKIAQRADLIIASRARDFAVGGVDGVYLERWWLIPRNKKFNVYLHRFLADDDDRACHCHPWPSMSLSLTKPMEEITLDRRFGGAVERLRFVNPGDLVFRRATHAHRMLVPEPGALTLFITGPTIREWYFWCNGRRPVHWRNFVDARDSGKVGRGCE